MKVEPQKSKLGFIQGWGSSLRDGFVRNTENLIEDATPRRQNTEEERGWGGEGRRSGDSSTYSSSSPESRRRQSHGSRIFSDLALPPLPLPPSLFQQLHL